MNGVDTNVLVRLFVNDTPAQHARVRKLVDSHSPEQPLFVSVIVLVELVWVLRSQYGYASTDCWKAVLGLLKMPVFFVEHEQDVAAALGETPELAGSLADELIALRARRAGCSAVFTFDRRAARDVSGMELLT